MNPTNLEKNSKLVKRLTTLTWILVGVGILVIILGICYYIYSNTSTTIDKNNFSLNELGDFLGGSVGPLWSLAGLLMIYISFIKQQEQIDKHDLEYNETQIENSFFQLFNFHLRIVDQMDIDIGRPVTGSDCFAEFYERLQTKYKESKKKLGDMSELDIITKAFLELESEFHDDISHYLKSIRNLFKFSLSSNHVTKGSQFYFDVLNSGLSTYEVLIVYYYLMVYKEDALLNAAKSHGVFDEVDNKLLLGNQDGDDSLEVLII